jgi:hypothetical protein
MKQLACPKCGSDAIIEWNRGLISYEVLVNEDGDIEYGNTDVCWDSIELCEDEPYWCKACDHTIEGELTDLIVEVEA